MNESPDNTVATYVVTEDIKEHVSSIFSQIKTGMGKGFCIQGFPGSGKSHFLSFITLLLKDKEAWSHPSEDVKSLRKEFYDAIKDKNFLVLYFSLTEGEDLRSLLYEKAEDQGVEIIRSKAIYENFFVERAQSVNWDDFYKFVEETEKLSKDDINELASLEDKRSIAEIIIKYGQARGLFPKERPYREILYPPILEGVEYVLDYAKHKGFDGAIAIVDELSQYLKERRDKKMMEIDISLLRSLEDVFRAGKPLWVIAAAHEDISKLMGYALDRFETLLQSKIDIRHIIAKRIAKKKKGKEGYIDDLYHEFSLLFPGFPESVTQDEFRDLYPFHKSFIENAVFLAQEASRMRSIVLICWECLHDIRQKEKSKPDEKDPHNLIMLDALYDKFLLDPRIRERYNKYFQIYEEFFKTDIIPKMERNRKLAHKLIKSLIILAITGRDRISVKDLTHVLLERIYKLEKTVVNYQGVKDTLDELKRLSLDKYLRLTPVGKDPLDYVYYIDLTKGATLEEELLTEMEKIRAKGDEALKAPLRDILNSREPLFENTPIQEIEIPISKEISWNNTPRKGNIRLALPKNIRTLPKLNPVDNDIDFSFIVSMPFYTTQEEDLRTAQGLLRETNDPRIFFWLPKEMDEEEKEKIRRYEAIRILQDKYKKPKTTEEREKAAELPIKLSEIQEEIEYKIELLFRVKGVVCNATGKLPLRLADYIDARQIIEKSAEGALNDYYNQHPKYRAKVSRAQTNKLIRTFIKEAKTEHKTSEITNYAEPLGIVNDRLELDAERSGYVKELLNHVPEDEIVEVNDLYSILREKNYGMQDFSFEVLLAAMIKQGLVTAKTQEGETYSPDQLDQVGSGSKAIINIVKSVEKGKMVNYPEPWANVVKILTTIHPDTKTSPYSTATQHGMWETAKKRIEEEEDKLNLTKSQLEKLIESTENEEMTDLLSPIETLQKVYQEIDPSLDPKKGLEILHDKVLEIHLDLEGFREAYDEVEKLKVFCGKRKDDKLTNAYSYLKAIIQGYEGIENIRKLKHFFDVSLLENLWQRFSELKKLILDNKYYKKFASDYEKFTDSYAGTYTGRHRDYYTRRRTFNAKLGQLKESKEYSTLKLLTNIRKVKTSPSFDEVTEELDQQVSACGVEGLYGKIKNSPFCECGYKVGQEEEILTTEDIENKIAEGVLAHIKILEQKATKSRILSYVDKEPVPISIKRNISKLLEIDPTRERIRDICALINEKAVETINEALKDAVHIWGKDLVDELVGSYSLGQILDATQQRIKALTERRIKEEGMKPEDKDILVVITKEKEA